MTGRVREIKRRLHFAQVHRPFTLALAIGAGVPGITAIIYGDAASRALETIAAGVLSRVIGVALLGSSIALLIGIAYGKSLWEVIGLGLVVAGCTLYGLGVLLGLALGGMIAGPLALIIALGAALRMMSLTIASRMVTDHNPDQ